MKQKKQKKNLLPVWSGSETQQLNSAYFATFMNVAVRLALLCMAAAGVILMFLQMYEVPVNARVVIAQTVFFSLIFNITFIFVRFRFAFPFFGFILLLYLRFSDILHDLGCLADYLLIYIDGGALSTAGYASRPAAMVTVRITYELQQSMQEAVIFCAIILVFIFAVAARGKFIGSILITSVLLLVPAIASQKASYVPAITLLVSSMFGLYSIWASQEQSFLKSISRKRKSKKPPYIPQIHRHSVNGAASACLALVTIMTAQALLPLEKARDTIQFWGQASERVIDFFHDVGDLLGTGFTSFTHFGTPQLDSSGYMAGGGINTSGSLSISNPTISGRPVLNVTLDYNHSPVYLRSDIGSSYDAVRERWNIDSRANNMRGFPDNFYPEHEYLIFRQKVSNLGYLVDSLIGRQSVTVEHLVRTPHIMLPTSPYLPSYKSDPRFTWRNDTVLNRRGSNNPQVYNWSALYPRHSNHLGNAIDDVQQLIQGVRPLSGAEASLYAISGSFEDYIFLEKFNEDASITEGALRIYVTEYGLSAEEYLHYLALYEEMVYDVYLEVTASESANIQLAISNVVGGDTVIDDYGMTWTGGTPLHRMDNYQKAFAIENYFKTNFTYSLIVDNHSGNNSYLGNFLHESQAGHCALYATAMTLMLRELGIPARYVTGFVAGGANASLFGDGGDRVLHVIRERDLHAWVEVYFPGVGWLPFDPTPPIYDYMFLEAEAGVTVTITTTTAPPVTTTTPIVTTTTPVVTTPNPIITTPSASPPAQSGEAPEQPVQKPDYTALLLAVLMITLIILLIAGIIAAVVMFFKGIERAEKRRLAKYAKLCEPETAREAYRFMLKLLKMEKLTAMAGETPVKFALRIDEAIAEPVLASAIDATLKLEFSREELKAEEYAQLSAAVEGLYKQIVTEQKRFKRLARRIVALGVIK